jgi:hypothetical protein
MHDREQSSSPPPQPVAVIPSVHPDAWEDFAVFRESFLMYFTAPGLNTALRGAAESFFTLLLEHSGGKGWPPWEESSTRTELHAAVADLRHSVGFLASIGKERKISTLAPGDHKLSKYAGDTARVLNKIANGIERKLAKEASS